MFFSRTPIVYWFLLLVLTGSTGYGQEASISTVDKVMQFPEKLLGRLSRKQADVSDKLSKQTVKYLHKLSRRERRLQQQLAKIDSVKANELFGDAQSKYTALTKKMQNASTLDPGGLKGTYLPYVDSIKTSLKFLNQHPELSGSSREITGKLQSSLGDMNQLQSRLQQSDEIKAFVKHRQQQIKQTLGQYTNLPAGLTNGYGDLSKNVYYYQAQVQEYKNLVNDPDKLEQKALEWLNKLPAFQSFMAKHSMLSSLFRVPANYGTPEALAGLQTRAQVQQLISSRVGGSAGAQSMVQQNIQAAQSQFSQLKDKMNQLGGGGELAMPDFKPNAQKTKPFKDRIELGSNVQTVKSDLFFPTTTDVGASAGYKLNDKSVVGLGASYKFGLGRGFRAIHFTSEGMGLRSFMDYKLKGSFWLTGGAEMNYRARFDHFEVLKRFTGWQQSALIGLSKKYQVSKQVKGNAQFLYDALWKQQIPRGQALKFRIGYTLK